MDSSSDRIGVVVRGVLKLLSLKLIRFTIDFNTKQWSLDVQVSASPPPSMPLQLSFGPSTVLFLNSIRH